ncbi:MAG: TIGR03936 family radical SAM-associated protein [Clostridiales Family XIII bacterium]|jgi:radical SAM-linked protein|nr:TIGR03936 family radical SAM-associated protein [Clostridiales Family XIII bacterium]
MKYILKFSKHDRTAYISHLDLQRLFIRILRMVGARPTYSNGFNPHPRLSFALPLPLGFESDGEYLEFEVDEHLDTVVVLDRINTRLPHGMRALVLREKSEAYSKPLASYIYSSEYSILAPAWANVAADVDEFAKRDSIIIEKTSRKTGKTREINIAEMMISMDVIFAYNSQMLLHLRVRTQNNDSINPNAVMSKFYQEFGHTWNPISAHIIRKQIFIEDGTNVDEI